ncbi:MAG: GIY-YIG nuclease family protein [Saprospiraceae bacterium]|nr:GIY-YIG nuclease family protein [Saprospiraceae bacterium]
MMSGFGGQCPPAIQTWYVYILKCRDGTHYVGKTKDIVKRLERHEKGQVSYTAPRRPVSLVVYIAFPDEWKAVGLEKYLKSGAGRAFAKKHFYQES